MQCFHLPLPLHVIYQDLKRKEAELNKREADLKRREAELEASGGGKKKNWPV